MTEYTPPLCCTRQPSLPLSRRNECAHHARTYARHAFQDPDTDAHRFWLPLPPQSGTRLLPHTVFRPSRSIECVSSDTSCIRVAIPCHAKLSCLSRIASASHRTAPHRTAPCCTTDFLSVFLSRRSANRRTYPLCSCLCFHQTRLPSARHSQPSAHAASASTTLVLPHLSCHTHPTSAVLQPPDTCHILQLYETLSCLAPSNTLGASYMPRAMVLTAT